MKSWNRFFRQFQTDFKLWLFCLVYSQIYRVIFIYSFRQKISELSGLKDIIVVLLNGLCFDAMIAAYFMLIPFIMSVVCGFTDLEKTAKRVRLFIGGLFVSLSTVLNVFNYGFFKEYNEQFNAFLFQFFYDDTRAIIVTIVQEYPFLVCAAITAPQSYKLLVIVPVFYIFCVNIVTKYVYSLANSITTRIVAKKDKIITTQSSIK